MSRRAVVMGLGTFGGGSAAARHLAAQGFRVLVTDRRSADDLAAPLCKLDRLIASGTIALRLGMHDPSDFADADLVVVNPGVPKPWDNEFVRLARSAGARLTTEVALAFDALPAHTTLIGVTGSVGKSTTASMIHAGLTAAGIDAALGGNIGGSLLDRTTDPDWAVVELSSAMLWWLDQPGALMRPGWLDVAVATNLSPNHLDWHGDLDHYAACKRVIVDRLSSRTQQYGRPDTAAVLGPSLADWPLPAGVRRLSPPPDDALHEPLACPGTHNRLNARLALAACRVAGADDAKAARGIARFAGLPHRLELVRTARGVRWINDSKSTTPEATSTALDAVAGGPVHLIVGGSDKGTDPRPLADLAGCVASLGCIGQTGQRIAQLAGLDADGTLDAAVDRLRRTTAPGETVLLSPGCASFDQFRSFEHRGDTFRTLVEALP
ncbi:MAG: UDP-N-acetylmuramoyl-L-alanine--D-glutamate ligase [Planctomycetota bacterium]